MSAPAGPARPADSRRLAYFATAVCALAVTAAVVSFANGLWMGAIWLLLAGLSSNMAWYYLRRARLSGSRGGADS
ncbi:hypothetical protein ACFQLX_17935 [Streptomyces polyrhachis]|uniref:Secreted protein n=1 Tax=Streptomyces polyrhachis TaxID=1282885 RepID=A0ABW2GGY7_9ACTN